MYKFCLELLVAVCAYMCVCVCVFVCVCVCESVCVCVTESWTRVFNAFVCGAKVFIFIAKCIHLQRQNLLLLYKHFRRQQ